jgi:PadR family transcriptional regulator AphA
MSTPNLTPTARVILGMLALGKSSGYDIKQLVDHSTRFFWAASYGQLYPELRRLEREGLITGRAEPTGGRNRTAYELTPTGREALAAWLREPDDGPFEVRSEGMLKLFFSDMVGRDERLERLRAMRRDHERVLDALCPLQADGGPTNLGPALTLELGVGIHRFIAEWCRATERRLSAESRDAITSEAQAGEAQAGDAGAPR